MKIVLTALAAGVLLASASTVCADQAVRGYFRSNGTYVQPHYRSSPNPFRFDNYSSQGNTHPYTGKPGSRPHELSSRFRYDRNLNGFPLHRW